MKQIIASIVSVLLATTVFAQEDFLADDYKLFGRKEPFSLGALFSALGTGSVLVNPANVAFVSDNRISFGGGASGIGEGGFISWMAPNFSISSSVQKVESSDLPGINHEKQLLHFGFGISASDLGYGSEKRDIGLGMAIKRKADRLLNPNDDQDAGGNSVSVDLGLVVKWDRLAFEMVVVDMNRPRLSHSDFYYGRGLLLGGRFSTAAGLTIALQGIGGNHYAGSDFGLSVAAEQSFMDRRLVSRLQLTSFYHGSEATAQNISASIGYRLNPKTQTVSFLAFFLKDLEFSYALSFLALPQNVGTHMVVVTKYF